MGSHHLKTNEECVFDESFCLRRGGDWRTGQFLAPQTMIFSLYSRADGHFERSGRFVVRSASNSHKSNIYCYKPSPTERGRFRDRFTRSVPPPTPSRNAGGAMIGLCDGFTMSFCDVFTSFIPTLDLSSSISLWSGKE